MRDSPFEMQTDQNLLGNTLIVTAIVGIILAGALVAGLVIPVYNRFVAMRNRADQAFATVDVMLKRRYDAMRAYVK